MGEYLNDDDVVMAAPCEIRRDLKSMAVGAYLTTEILTLLGEGSNAVHAWFEEDGVSCQVLRTTGGGWKGGRLRLRLEFLPDEPEQVPDESQPPPENRDDVR